MRVRTRFLFLVASNQVNGRHIVLQGRPGMRPISRFQFPNTGMDRPWEQVKAVNSWSGQRISFKSIWGYVLRYYPTSFYINLWIYDSTFRSPFPPPPSSCDSHIKGHALVFSPSDGTLGLGGVLEWGFILQESGDVFYPCLKIVGGRGGGLSVTSLLCRTG